MSGRKKNRKHHRGQPPSELLDELSSLRELLGSDMEADIPLLDQVAKSASEAPQHRPPQQPVANQRPLQEADLPILFSPIDEEPADDFVPQLSEADRKLLRPLQNLPRKPELATADATTPAEAEMDAHKTMEKGTSEKAARRDEYQPGLFDSPQQRTNQAKRPERAAAYRPPETAVPMSENPFLPPHIRARLTGGRIPRPDAETPAAKPQDRAEPPAPEAESQIMAMAVEAAEQAAKDKPRLSQREQLIEQLVAEQLPELERQLRTSITLMLDELYPAD